ncbi:MAG TPA: helix-turn-helix domain-containing protein [Pilimelia sp.]|nr:helix-turn-helix domain-containing protein [Pilimelia sp.]
MTADRRADVARLRADGLSFRAISARLNISRETARVLGGGIRTRRAKPRQRTAEPAASSAPVCECGHPWPGHTDVKRGGIKVGTRCVAGCRCPVYRRRTGEP